MEIPIVKLSPSLRSFVRKALAAVVVFASAQGMAVAQTVKFMDIPGTGNLLARVAISKGYCKQNGLDCQLQVIPAAPLGVQAMMAGTIDSAIAPVDVMIGAVKNGTAMKMVVGGLASNLLVLVERNDIAGPNAGKPFPQFMQDLKGKKIGVIARGSSTETGIRYLFAKAGLNPDDATYVAVGGAVTAYNALQSKQIDAAMIVEPVGSICEVSKTCRVVWRGASDKDPSALYGLNGGNIGMVFMQKTITEKPDMIAAVIRSMREADAFINNPVNFEEVVKIATSYFKFDLADGDAIMRSNLKQFIKDRTYSTVIDRKAIAAGLTYLKDTKFDVGTIGVSDLVYDKAP
jgi:NitT/TauT family transport system substrate-binding protein